MKEFGGWFFPDGETHFQAWMSKRNEVVDGRLTYQYHKLSAAMEYVKQFRVAADVGGHVGTWAHYLAKRFMWVHSFEPVADFRDCFSRNVLPRNVELHDCALGAGHGRVSMIIPPLGDGIDTGGTHVGGNGDIQMRTLDSFGLTDVDFIKLDVEGFEDKVIEGARETIKRWQPCVIVEQKPHKLGPNFGINGTPAVDLLKAMGYTVRRELGGDYILTV